jgi:cation:H+ antiporter
MDLLILLVSFFIILAGAELFTNGIEWFGKKLGLDEGAVGSVLAAVGTALPETMIPIVAILFSGQEHSDEIGVGAILGAPFMLATLAMFVTGVAVLYQAKKRPAGDVMPVDTVVLAHDVRYFAIAYAIAIGAAFLPLEPVQLKWIVAVVLIGIYAWYVKAHFEADPDTDAEDLAPLRFRRLDPRGLAEDPHSPRLRVVNVQVIAALSLIVLGAYFFVGSVEHLATSFGLDEALLALVIAPIATELPEKFNSIIWVRQGKDTLAMGNITGAMVFQSTLPVAIGLAFTPWELDRYSIVAGCLALAGGLVAVVTLHLRRRFSWQAIVAWATLYSAFVVYVALSS